MKNNTLKKVQADIEGMDILKDELCKSNGEQMMTNDDTRDIAIRCVDRLVSEGYVKDCVDTDDITEFSVQDIIHEEINKTLNIDMKWLRCEKCGISSEEVSLISEADICYQCEKEESEVK